MDLEYHFATEEERAKYLMKPIYEDGWKYELVMNCIFMGHFTVDVVQGLILNNETGKIYSTPNNHGYIDVAIKYNNIVVHTLAHRIIWWCVYGLIDNNLMINHINGIKTDNRIANLELVTNAENVKHAWDIGICSHEKLSNSLKERYKNNISSDVKLSQEQISQIFDMYYNKHMGIREICRYFNIYHNAISEILGGTRYIAWTKELLQKYGVRQKTR